MGGGKIARVVLDSPLPLMRSQPFVMIRQGGSGILGNGRILWIEPARDRRRLADLLSALPERPNELDFLGVEIRLCGALRQPGRQTCGLCTGIAAIGEWLFDEKRLAELKSEIRELSRTAGCCTSSAAASKFEIPEAALKAVLDDLVEKGELVTSGGTYKAAGGRPAGGDAELSTPARVLLDILKRAGAAGFEPDTAGVPGSKAELRNLCALGLAVPLEGRIYYCREVYEELVSAILSGRAPSSRFSIPEAKQASGLSRKYIIPLLNRMEADGWVRREGDARAVLKLPVQAVRA
jgi:selenocysteine-specific elongation factor